MSIFTIYHGHAFQPGLETCREVAPDITHGVEYQNPEFCPADAFARYIVDNGAYSASQDDSDWDEERFEAMLSIVEGWERDPDFVVCPDVFGSWDETQERAAKWYPRLVGKGLDVYVVGQPPASVSELVDHADRHGSPGVFLGGPQRWKYQTASSLVDRVGDRLQVHIGRPGDLLRAKNAGADSVDTTSIYVNNSWDRLRRLSTQRSLSEWSDT